METVDKDSRGQFDLRDNWIDASMVFLRYICMGKKINGGQQDYPYLNLNSLDCTIAPDKVTKADTFVTVKFLNRVHRYHYPRVLFFDHMVKSNKGTINWTIQDAPMN